MPKPYIDTYLNANGDLVLVYISEVNIMERVEPEHIVIKQCHLESVVDALNDALNELEE